MWNSAKRGRLIVGIILAIQLLLAIAVVSMAVAMNRFDKLPGLLCKLLVNISTAFALWYGVRWIRWLYVLGLSMSSIYLMYLAVTLPMGVLPAGVFVLAVVVAWLGGLLGFSDAVHDFFRWQRGELKPIDWPDSTGQS